MKLGYRWSGPRQMNPPRLIHPSIHPSIPVELGYHLLVIWSDWLRVRVGVALIGLGLRRDGVRAGLTCLGLGLELL